MGAHVGFMSVELGHFFDHVHAFEPQEENYDCLQENVGDNVDCHNVAVGAENGTISLTNPSLTNSGAWEAGPGDDIVSVTLDDFFALDEEYIDFIKIDVQGYENEVIRGATRTIELHRPVMLVELSKDKDESVKTMHKLLRRDMKPVFKVREDMIFVPKEKEFFID